MIRNDEHWLALTDAFNAAAFDPSRWYGALEGLAEATGSANGELIGLGAHAAVPFNILTNVDPELGRAFVEMGGGDPKLNPRVNAGMHAPVLKVLAESDFITRDEYKRHPHYQEFAVPWRIPYICLTTLERSDGMLVGLAVLRTERQGHISQGQREAFTRLAPHVRAAVRTQMALEGDGAALLVGAMDALSIPAFVCDRQGRVRALSPSAEQLISQNHGLLMRQGRLHAANPAEDRTLRAAVDAAACGPGIVGGPPLRTIVIRYGSNKERTVVLDIVALPARQLEFSFAPRVLVVARSERGQESRRAAILKVAYGLTASEADIAVHIASGVPPEEIAICRGVTVGTIRFQLKSILAKVGVTRQAALAARVAQL